MGDCVGFRQAGIVGGTVSGSRRSWKLDQVSWLKLNDACRMCGLSNYGWRTASHSFQITHKGTFISTDTRKCCRFCANVNIFAKVHNTRELCEKIAYENLNYREMHIELIIRFRNTCITWYFLATLENWSISLGIVTKYWAASKCDCVSPSTAAYRITSAVKAK